MSSSHSPQPSTAPYAGAAAPPVNVFLRLLPLTVAVFIGFLTIGLPLPVLPLHLSQHLGLGALGVGVVVGGQFAAALLSRAWAGNLADARGAKRAVVSGLLLATASGIAYLVSLGFADAQAAVWTLLAGRLLLGCAESLIVTGALGWGVGMAGPQNAGKVMAWVGIAMYGAYAAGAPAGVAVNARWGFTGISLATALVPLLALAIVLGLRGTAAAAHRRTPFYKVLGSVWVPGLGLALSSVGFGVITTFAALLFADRGWGTASVVFTAFGLAFIAARLAFGHLPDQLGGARVALICIPIAVLGQLLIWGANAVSLAAVGAALTGFGYSLAFPAFGVEAVRRAPPQARGVAMGAYVAFLDISLGITGPVAGLIAGSAGVGAVYLVGAAAVALSFGVALQLRLRPASGVHHA
ncbi:arabinose transporter [Pseudorhodoferax sp. Leaf265]|uniref:arabinose transporter n=1 Tax=Pseudorhodoferax sp. Leaf265 TaxID=1736315 RepID=UPI0006F97D5A|nr:arabinose transporter [Pseudorhodoferax sp. Leaf265]KQP05323.1 MFS transporter [Pseudorhodoferax sp. Leaf265]